MGNHGVLWHFAQILPILTAAGWGIACIACAFTVPDIDDYNTSINTSSGSSNSWFFDKRQTFNTSPSTNFSNNVNNNQAAFNRQRTWILTLWVGTAIAWFSVIANLAIYILLLLADRYIRSRANTTSWLRRRKILVYLTAFIRALGLIAGIALGAYYASTKSTKLAAASALGFVFAIACLIAIVVTLMKKVGPSNGGGEKEWYGQQHGSGQTGYQPQQQGAMQGGYPPQHGYGNGANDYGVPAARK